MQNVNNIYDHTCLYEVIFLIPVGRVSYGEDQRLVEEVDTERARGVSASESKGEGEEKTGQKT